MMMYLYQLRQFRMLFKAFIIPTCETEQSKAHFLKERIEQLPAFRGKVGGENEKPKNPNGWLSRGS
jgi:hypothetical protein